MRALQGAVSLDQQLHTEAARAPRGPTSPSAPSSRYRSDIDGLRAIAVTSVVLYHAGLPGIPGGFVGVDVFFVISGFLITGLLLGELTQRGSIDFAHFYARRIRRLMPNLALVTVATVVAGVFLLSAAHGEVQATARAAIATMLLSANMHFLHTLDDYFAGPADHQPLLHMWSLAVEEQFYVVWPLLLYLAWIFTRRSARRAAWLQGAIALVIVASGIAAAALTAQHLPAAFYLTPARGWELALGALLAAGVTERAQITAAPVLGSAAAIIGLAMIFVSILVIVPGSGFPVPWALLPAIGTSLVIVGNAMAPSGPVNRLLSVRPMVLVGLASYSWYLWHWPVLSIARIRALGEADHLRDLGLAAASLIVALIVYRTVESPLRHYRRRDASDRTVILLGLAAMAVVIGCAAGAIRWAKLERSSMAASELQRAAADRPPLEARCHLDMGSSGSTTLGPCLAETAEPRLVLWGDSHASHWSPALYTWAGQQAQPVGIDYLTKGGCPPLIGALPTEVGARQWKAYEPCRAFNDLIRRRIEAIPEGGRTGVVLAANWWYRVSRSELGEIWPERRHSYDVSVSDPDSSLAVLEQRLGETLALLERRGARTLLMLQSPVMESRTGREVRAPECLLRQTAAECSVPLERHLARAREVNAVLARTAARFANVRIIDPTEHLCPRQHCPAKLAGRVAYTDSSHLAASLTTNLSEALGGHLKWLTQAR